MGKDEKILIEAAKEYGVDPKADMWRLPAMFVGQYAERDAEATLKLWKRLEVEIYNQELTDIFSLETRLFPCLVDMRFKGVKVDLEKAQHIKQNLIKREETLIKKN
jgi:DNA polymerase I-like protein with 3'-5' exonuclease and polymerase domains